MTRLVFEKSVKNNVYGFLAPAQPPLPMLQ